MNAHPDASRPRPSPADEPAPAAIHLAAMIDFKEAKLERTLLPFQRKQLTVELESLVRRFQIEYGHFINTTG